LPTIDAYLSAESFEPSDGDEHYTERLVRLPNWGVHCRPYGVEPAPFDREAWGLSAEGPLLICPGVPYKYRPQDDRMLVDIARGLGRCTFVFFRHDVAALSQRLQGRIGAAFAAAGLDPARFIRWLPWQPRAAFFGLLRQADVYLDTVGFSGFNTMMQAVECHLPCVTLDGRFLRGRLGSGILRRLDLAPLVATDRAGYVARAVRLAGDASHRAAIREQLRHKAARGYGDTGAIRALERVLLEPA